MPTYNFCCPKCHYEFADVFSIKDSDSKKLTCSRCDYRGLKKVFRDPFSIINKDSNFLCSSGICSLTKERN